MNLFDFKYYMQFIFCADATKKKKIVMSQWKEMFNKAVASFEMPMQIALQKLCVN